MNELTKTKTNVRILIEVLHKILYKTENAFLRNADCAALKMLKIGGKILC